MEEIKFELLNPENEKELIEYEKGLYKNFKEKAPDSWVINNYQVIDNCRFRHPCLDYENDQVVYLVKMGDKIVGGSASNLNSDKLSVEMKGFSLLEKDKGQKVAEALTVYLDDNYLGKDSFKVGMELSEYMIKDLKKRGYVCWYGTGYKERRALHELLGFEMLNSKLIDGKERFLIRFDLIED